MCQTGRRCTSWIAALLLVALVIGLFPRKSLQAASATEVTSLNFSEGNEIILRSGEKKTLSVELVPDSEAQTKIEWTSSSTSIAFVNEQGEVTANKKGTATIQAKETYSGLTKSITVKVLPKKMEYVRRPYRASIVLKKDTDFFGTYLDWNIYNMPEDVSYYKIFVGSKPNKQSKVIYEEVETTVPVLSYSHAKLKKGKKYYYYVIAYNSKGKKLATSNKVTAKATEPNIGVRRVSGGGNEVVWKSQDRKHIKGIRGYRIYRSNRADGTYKCVKQINSKKTVSWKDSKAPETTCYYKVCAFKKKGKKKINGAMSKSVASDDYDSSWRLGR